MPKRRSRDDAVLYGFLKYFLAGFGGLCFAGASLMAYYSWGDLKYLVVGVLSFGAGMVLLLRYIAYAGESTHGK